MEERSYWGPHSPPSSYTNPTPKAGSPHDPLVVPAQSGETRGSGRGAAQRGLWELGDSRRAGTGRDARVPAAGPALPWGQGDQGPSCPKGIRVPNPRVAAGRPGSHHSRFRPVPTSSFPVSGILACTLTISCLSGDSHDQCGSQHRRQKLWQRHLNPLGGESQVPNLSPPPGGESKAFALPDGQLAGPRPAPLIGRGAGPRPLSSFFLKDLKSLPLPR
ncbi:uncharacterized protein LOC116418564 [Piliocolobus tephrosceles]|uniref:uncharacterized protein LOC116418564 n=1 Tax=Piliocolobus tephrosceles TaxID=591936 RepID=UPI0013014B8B|nr:uncharacterized protein LOC116418564 [Piliocolobus tephrosceles]